MTTITDTRQYFMLVTSEGERFDEAVAVLKRCGVRTWGPDDDGEFPRLVDTLGCTPERTELAIVAVGHDRAEQLASELRACGLMVDVDKVDLDTMINA